MTKSELIEIITAKQKHLPARDVELALKQILEIMSDALSQGQRIEIRGFGSFSLSRRQPRVGRNPKSGERVHVPAKRSVKFKVGRMMKQAMAGDLTEQQLQSQLSELAGSDGSAD